MASTAATTTRASLTAANSEYFHPLTTLFTPPPSCLQDPFTLFSSTTNIVGFSTAWRDRNETSSQCYPYSFSTFQFYWTFYTPGVCPSGYTEAQTRTISSRTQAWCCPSGMTISASGIYQFCSSFVPSPTMALAASTTLSGDILTDIYTVQSTASFIALQWPLSVEWRESDLDFFTPVSAPVLTTTAVSSSSRSSSSSAPSSTPSSGDLSTGAKIGIGVGAGVGALLVLIAIGIMIVCMRRRKRTKEELAPAYSEHKPEHVRHLHSYTKPPMYELDAHVPVQYELDGVARPAELETPSALKHSGSSVG